MGHSAGGRTLPWVDLHDRLHPSSTAPLGTWRVAQGQYSAVWGHRHRSRERCRPLHALHEPALALPELVYRERVVKPHTRIALRPCAYDVRWGAPTRASCKCDHARAQPDVDQFLAAAPGKGGRGDDVALKIATKLEESVYSTAFGHGRAGAQSGGGGGGGGGARWSCMAMERVHEMGGSSRTNGDQPVYDSIPDDRGQ